MIAHVIGIQIHMDQWERDPETGRRIRVPVRTVEAISPRGNLVHHGAGKVGTPLLPYMGSRGAHDGSGGYTLQLPQFRPEVVIFDGWDDARDRMRTHKGSWKDVGAPDVTARSFKQKRR